MAAQEQPTLEQAQEGLKEGLRDLRKLSDHSTKLIVAVKALIAEANLLRPTVIRALTAFCALGAMVSMALRIDELRVATGCAWSRDTNLGGIIMVMSLIAALVLNTSMVLAYLCSVCKTFILERVLACAQEYSVQLSLLVANPSAEAETAVDLYTRKLERLVCIISFADWI